MAAGSAVAAIVVVLVVLAVFFVVSRSKKPAPYAPPTTPNVPNNPTSTTHLKPYVSALQKAATDLASSASTLNTTVSGGVTAASNYAAFELGSVAVGIPPPPATNLSKAATDAKSAAASILYTATTFSQSVKGWSPDTPIKTLMTAKATVGGLRAQASASVDSLAGDFSTIQTYFNNWWSLFQASNKVPAPGTVMAYATVTSQIKAAKSQVGKLTAGAQALDTAATRLNNAAVFGPST